MELTNKLTSMNNGCKVIYKSVDIGDHEAVDAAVSESITELGEIDILVNNVGLFLSIGCSDRQLCPSPAIHD